MVPAFWPIYSRTSLAMPVGRLEMQRAAWLVGCSLRVRWTPQGPSRYRLPGVCPCCLCELAGVALGNSLGCSRLLFSLESAQPSLRVPGCLHMDSRLPQDGSGCICHVAKPTAVQLVVSRAPSVL